MNVSVTPGETVNPTVTFVDPGLQSNPQETYSIQWTWGDGNTTPGTFTGYSGDTGTGSGSHQYHTGAPPTVNISVQIMDSGGATVSTVSSSCSTTAAPVSRFRLSRRATQVTFRWRLASHAGVVGFELFARSRRLDPRVISVHQGEDYRYTARYAGPGPFTLHALLRGGGKQVFNAR
jgi:hypothetical protein